MKNKITKILILFFLCVGSLYAEPSYYEMELLGQTFGCKYEDGTFTCNLAKNNPLNVWITSINEAPYPNLEDEITFITTEWNKQDYSILSKNLYQCPNENKILFHFLAINKNNTVDDTVVLMAPTYKIYLEQYFDDISNQQEITSLFSFESFHELCSLSRANNYVHLFNKLFACTRLEQKSENTVKFECKLDESDSQYKTLFGQNSYLTQNPIFNKPKKFLSQMIKDKELGCEKYQLFSCPNKDTAVGICRGKEGETFIQVTPHVVFTLTNTDLSNSIADKAHADELCNWSWKNFEL